MSQPPRLFGRKKVYASEGEPTGTSEHGGQKRIFAESLWNSGTSSAKIFELAGVSKDDPSNFMPTNDSLNLIAEQKSAQLDRKTEIINAAMSPMKLIPYAMIPWDMWRGFGFGRFLLNTCKLYPTEPWNTMYLPENDETAATLGLPLHPMGYPDALVQVLHEDLQKMSNHDERITQPQRLKALRGDAQLIQIISDIVNSYKQSIHGYAAAVSKVRFGSDIFEKHEKIFRTMIQEQSLPVSGSQVGSQYLN